jgi:antitoxin (DNA-binding transcriptional repressor) of toxin-antitoxin stability system
LTDVIQVNMHEAKSQLSQLAERVWRGERVVIAKAGKPYLDLLPHTESGRQRQPGRLRGKVRLTPNFDQTPADIIDDFEQSGL